MSGSWLELIERDRELLMKMATSSGYKIDYLFGFALVLVRVPPSLEGNEHNLSEWQFSFVVWCFLALHRATAGQIHLKLA